MLYFRREVNCSVILMHGRSGSTYLVQALNNHSNVRTQAEILVSLKTDGVDAQLNRIERTLTPPLVGKAIGFKTKLTDLIEPNRVADLACKNHSVAEKKLCKVGCVGDE